MFRSGYIAIVGRPNVGKSTLLNAFSGQKIAAVSAKPQMTRHRILGIKHLPHAQLLFLDTPGIHKPHRDLNEYMMEMARAALDDADLFLFLVEASKSHTPEISKEDREIYQMLSKRRKPILVVITKADKVGKDSLLPLMDECLKAFSPVAVVPISATKEVGLSGLEQEILKHLPEGPAYFSPEQVTDQSERFLVAEIIREKIMELTREEVPYSVAILIEAFQEPKESDAKKITRIRAAIITEKDSQKGILIGKKGAMAKKIGELARKELEGLLGTKIFLELFVRVEKDWSKNQQKVKEFGYKSNL